MNKRKQKQVKKDKKLLIIGIILITMAILQFSMVLFYLISSENGNNQIVFNDKVITTEVCTNWFNSTLQHSAIDNNKNFYYKNEPIPMNVVSEVCDKWKKVKEEIDNNG